MNKNLIVCGDSFQSISDQSSEDLRESFIGTHWSEVLSKKLDYNLINLAMPGCSNSLIVLQIMEAIKLNPSLIIIGWSAGHGHRTEYLKNPMADPVGNINLGHFIYKFRPHPYDKLGFLKNTILLSSNIPDIPHEQFKNQMLIYSGTHFFEYFKEECMMIHAISKLSLLKIPFLMFETGVGHPYPSNWIIEMLNFCKEENIIYKKDFYPWYNLNRSNQPPVYHTSKEVQVKIANYIEDRMKLIL